jgi:hypothetical protein
MESSTKLLLAVQVEATEGLFYVIKIVLLVLL